MVRTFSSDAGFSQHLAPRASSGDPVKAHVKRSPKRPLDSVLAGNTGGGRRVPKVAVAQARPGTDLRIEYYSRVTRLFAEPPGPADSVCVEPAGAADGASGNAAIRKHRRVSGEPFGSGRRRRARVENRSLLVGQQSGAHDESHAFRCFQRESATPALDDIHGEMGVFPPLELIAAHPEFGMPRETSEQYVGAADPEFSGRKAHRRAAVTAPTGQVEQDRPVLFDQAPQHDLRRFGQLYAMDSFVHQQDPIPHQKNPSSVGE